MVKGIIFDLDGTLLDTIGDLALSMNLALTRFGFPTRSFEEHRRFIGNGVPTFSRRALPEDARSEQNIQKIIHAMEEEYLLHYNEKTYIYEEINELLLELQKKSFSLAVCTNKIDSMAKKMVQEFFPTISFAQVLGSSLNLPRKPDPFLALHIAEKLKIPPSEFLFVGDSEVDIETAKNAKMKSVAVLWGSRSKDELEKFSPDFVISSPLELLKILH